MRDFVGESIKSKKMTFECSLTVQVSFRTFLGLRKVLKIFNKVVRFLLSGFFPKSYNKTLQLKEHSITSAGGNPALASCHLTAEEIGVLGPLSSIRKWCVSILGESRTVKRWSPHYWSKIATFIFDSFIFLLSELRYFERCVWILSLLVIIHTRIKCALIIISVSNHYAYCVLYLSFISLRQYRFIILTLLIY